MKNFKKFMAILILLSSTGYAFGMEQLEGTVSALEDELSDLKEKLEDLKTRVSGLEEAKEEAGEITYEACSPDGKNCKGIKGRKAHRLIARGGGKHHRRVKRCNRGRCNWMAAGVAHGNVQKDFQELQKKVGITPSTNIRAVKAIQGPQGTQTQFNTIRSQLNTLLAQETLNDADIKKIKAKIAELRALNPARRPAPEDYEEILNKIIESQE